jgi:uncharacterized protein (DUF2062 family)
MVYFKDKFRSIFQVKDSPHHIAMAFALGVFMGISPLLGLHYIGGFFLAWLFRLNKLVAMVGVTVNNPWTIVPISSFCAWFGAKLLGIKQILPEVDWKSISLMKILGWLKGLVTDFDNVMKLLNDLWPLIKAFFVGSFVICTVSAIASYFIIRVLITKYHKI